ncbi:hypothetical protein [Acrocarpospora corrugata]|nr:hypothetical protein [Acrocarpospora corrugata]
MIVALGIVVLQGAGGQVVDVPAAKDDVRRAIGPDQEAIRLTLSSVTETGPLQVVTPRGTGLTEPQRRFVQKFSYEEMAPGGVSLHDIHADFLATGAASLDQQFISIKLEGRRNQKIFIDNIRPVDVLRTAPWAGTLVNVRDQSGGETKQMVIDFDDVDPITRMPGADDLEDDAPPGGPYFQHKTLTLTDGTEDTVIIKAITAQWGVTFRIRIDYRVGGKAEHRIVDNNGRPFALTAMNCTKPSIAKQWVLGRISYEAVWEHQGSMIRSPHPNRHPVNYPECGQD